MNKKKQRLLAWMLCMVLTAVNIIPSAGIRALANEPETEQEQEDFFGTEIYLGGDITPETKETESAQTAIEESVLSSEAVVEAGHETLSTQETEFADEEETQGQKAENDAGDVETQEKNPDTEAVIIQAWEEQSATRETITDEQAETASMTEMANEDVKEETEIADSEEETETEESEQEDLGATLQIGKSTTLVCTASVNPAHPKPSNLNVNYSWYAEPSDIVGLDKIDKKPILLLLINRGR